MKIAKIALASGLLALAVAGSVPVTAAYADITNNTCSWDQDGSINGAFKYCDGSAHDGHAGVTFSGHED